MQMVSSNKHLNCKTMEEEEKAARSRVSLYGNASATLITVSPLEFTMVIAHHTCDFPETILSYNYLLILIKV